MDFDKLYDICYSCLISNCGDEGFYASGKQEIYGCFFGRDSELTTLKTLRAHTKKPSLPLLEVAQKSLLTLVLLQGKVVNRDSGEEPGKFIHEYRKDPKIYQHLLNLEKPWFVYPDGILRNYDSIDSTPLGLIAIYKYWQISLDNDFLIRVLDSVEAGLNWLISYGDMDKDLFIEYHLPTDRNYGGLAVQSWTDSRESMLQPDGQLPKYPIAPVEAQAYTWLALRLWADFYSESNSSFAQKLLSQAGKLKEHFNQKFILYNQGFYYAAQALDGDKNQIKTITGNPLLCLWASYAKEEKIECIVDDKYIPDFVNRAFLNDLFDPKAGIRTMSSSSPTFNPRQDSYHNGSFWPILNGLIYEGLEMWGFNKQAAMLKEASLLPVVYFGSPIELYVFGENGDYLEFRSSEGQISCKEQSWSAASILDLLS